MFSDTLFSYIPIEPVLDCISKTDDMENESLRFSRCSVLSQIDQLDTFAAHMKELELKEEEEKAKERERRRRKERKARESFRELLKELEEEGKITYQTRYRSKASLS